MEKAKVIKAYLAEIGRSKSPRKLAAIRLNIVKAQEAKAAKPEALDRAYRKFKAGHLSMSRAADTVAKCRYVKFKAYCEKRDANKTARP